MKNSKKGFTLKKQLGGSHKSCNVAFNINHETLPILWRENPENLNSMLYIRIAKKTEAGVA
jgi:hypothetical protein